VSSSSTTHHHVTRPLDAFGAAVMILLCVSWGFNQAAAKFAIHDIPPMTQALIRSVVAAFIVASWARLRGVGLTSRDGTLTAGLTTGALFGVEFVFLYQGLLYTTATRAVLFLYTAPFFVVVGSRVFLPADRFYWWQWTGLILSFSGIALAFGVPTPAADPRQALGDVLIVVGALCWAATTLTIKASALTQAPAEKVMLYQLVVSAPIFAAFIPVFGEHMSRVPPWPAAAALAYQTVWVVSVTFVIWFWMVSRYSASRLAAFTFLSPLCGVAAGHLLLGEPLNEAFAVSVALVAGGLILVNRPG
jgi:drug/metabolite transporter (DMT)-like permease